MSTMKGGLDKLLLDTLTRRTYTDRWVQNGTSLTEDMLITICHNDSELGKFEMLVRAHIIVGTWDAVNVIDLQEQFANLVVKHRLNVAQSAELGVKRRLDVAQSAT